jgi:hypothetical protein
LPDAAAVPEVPEDGEGLVVGQPCAEQGGAGALGEAVLAGAAGQHAALVLAVVESDPEVAAAAAAVVGAALVREAEGAEVVHQGCTEGAIRSVDTISKDCRMTAGV